MTEAAVCVVTVTYGSRWHYLRRVLDYCEREPAVGRVIVLDNGASADITASVERERYGKASVIRRAVNGGSAVGFHAALAAARDWNGFVLLLDDDNVPGPHCLAKLLATHAAHAAEHPGPLALHAFRPEHQADIGAGVPVRRCYPRSNSFLGFHVRDIPYKVWRRTRLGKPELRAGLPEVIWVPFAPYSGTFFHASLLAAIGLPEERFVLYADDTEFTHRIVRQGGRIGMVPGAEIEDLESSWNVKARFRSTFDQWLTGSSDTRAYYGCRNQVYFERQQVAKNPAVYAVNRGVYMLGLRLRARQLGAAGRMALVKRAVSDGLAGKLGVASECPLPT